MPEVLPLAGLLEAWQEIPAEIPEFVLMWLAIAGIRRRSQSRSIEPTAVAGNRNLTPAVRRQLWRLNTAFDDLYAWLCGTHPYRRPWHRQWLSTKDIYRDLRRVLPTLEGRLLDVGCMEKPYAHWATRVREHVGIDVFPGPGVDHLIREGEPWPIETGSVQSILCTQVLQVVRDVPHLVGELDRVLTQDGVAVITIPFCYNDMTAPHDDVYKDYWRHTVHGSKALFSERFEMLELRREGGIGSTIGVMFLNWIQLSMSRHAATGLLFRLGLPVWLPFCLAVNAAGWALDKLDRTGVFYHNVLLVLRKKGSRRVDPS